MTKNIKDQAPSTGMIQADPTEVVTILTKRIAELEKDKAVLTAALNAQQK